MQIIEKYLLNLIKLIVLAAVSILLISCGNTPSLEVPVSSTATITQFDGDRAFQHIVTQLDFGERTPGSIGHEKVVDWMVDELNSSNWDVSIQELPYGEYDIRNVIAKRGSGMPWIILGAHYDTRFFADQDMDPEMRLQPVPGANDGASGVAVLLELARVLPDDMPGDIWLVFFDAEDNGNIPGWDWILGSQAFVDILEGIPDAVVVIDMIGDKDLEIFWERNSDFELTRDIWQVATDLGYEDYFISQPGYRIIDDHLPFVREGIPAVDIIDFDYPAWHTVDDTIDKVSARSLKVVGDVLYHWLLTRTTNISSP